MMAAQASAEAAGDEAGQAADTAAADAAAKADRRRQRAAEKAAAVAGAAEAVAQTAAGSSTPCTPVVETPRVAEESGTKQRRQADFNNKLMIYKDGNWRSGSDEDGLAKSAQ
jgi:hypothetical protein